MSKPYSGLEWARSINASNELRHLRRKKGKSIKFIAVTMNISSAYLCDLEAGKRFFRPELVRAYRKALAV